jgi:exopolysaccharide/PEP-CTERM locus tyrosine autokinase
MVSLSDALANGHLRGSESHVANLAPLAHPADSRSTLGEISYTQTRVTTLNRATLRESRIISGSEPGPVADAYKILCIQVLQRLRERNGNALAIVSPGECEGKTLTAINLAISLSQEVDQTVLLVDANLRDPSMHRYFGFKPEAGLSDYLINNVPIDQVLVNPGIERFVLLPGGRPLLNSTEMLGSMKMERLVLELKMRYPSRIVIFDLPPVLSVADSMAFAPYVDAAIMVVQENRTKRIDVQRAASMLKSVELIGTVLNMASGAQGQDEESESEPVSGFWGRIFKRKR